VTDKKYVLPIVPQAVEEMEAETRRLQEETRRIEEDTQRLEDLIAKIKAETAAFEAESAAIRASTRRLKMFNVVLFSATFVVLAIIVLVELLS